MSDAMPQDPAATVSPLPDHPTAETANDRLKRSFGSWFWGSMIAATVVHFGVLALWPNLTASDLSFTQDDFEVVDLPPEIDIPPPPDEIQRPANPVVTDAQIDDDITIAPTTFESNAPEDLPPPRSEGAVDLADHPQFTPVEVRPEVRNEAAVLRALEREYPAMLRDSGIGGTVRMYFFIDEEGTVQSFRIEVPSTYSQFNEAALRVADVFEFTPAMNRDQRVPVWISMDITFRTR